MRLASSCPAREAHETGVDRPQILAPPLRGEERLDLAEGGLVAVGYDELSHCSRTSKLRWSKRKLSRSATCAGSASSAASRGSGAVVGVPLRGRELRRRRAGERTSAASRSTSSKASERASGALAGRPGPWIQASAQRLESYAGCPPAVRRRARLEERARWSSTGRRSGRSSGAGTRPSARGRRSPRSGAGRGSPSRRRSAVIPSSGSRPASRRRGGCRRSVGADALRSPPRSSLARQQRAASPRTRGRRPPP